MEKIAMERKKTPQPIERTIAEELLSKGKTLSVAESCTGGLLAHRLTTIPGSSGYFLGGIVAYSNSVKTSVLDVPEELLQNVGAVSAEVARAMTEGAQRLFKSDISISITGIAGPEGGSADKPVGTAYVGFLAAEKAFTRKISSSGSRLLNKIHFSQTALEILIQNI